MTKTNFQQSVDEEKRNVVRTFHRFTDSQRATMAANGRKPKDGEYLYTHPAIPGTAFQTKTRAAEAAVSAK